MEINFQVAAVIHRLVSKVTDDHHLESIQRDSFIHNDFGTKPDSLYSFKMSETTYDETNLSHDSKPDLGNTQDLFFDYSGSPSTSPRTTVEYFASTSDCSSNETGFRISSSSSSEFESKYLPGSGSQIQPSKEINSISSFGSVYQTQSSSQFNFSKSSTGSLINFSHQSNVCDSQSELYDYDQTLNEDELSVSQVDRNSFQDHHLPSSSSQTLCFDAKSTKTDMLTLKKKEQINDLNPICLSTGDDHLFANLLQKLPSKFEVCDSTQDESNWGRVGNEIQSSSYSNFTYDFIKDIKETKEAKNTQLQVLSTAWQQKNQVSQKVQPSLSSPSLPSFSLPTFTDPRVNKSSKQMFEPLKQNCQVLSRKNYLKDIKKEQVRVGLSRNDKTKTLHPKLYFRSLMK